MEIPEIISMAISSLGGGAVALGLFIKFGANKIADIISANNQNKLDKSLETHKAKVETKKYVTQFRFDKEFEILYKLVHDYYEFTYLTWDVCLTLEGYKRDVDESHSAFQKACDEYTKYFFGNSVLINKDIAEIFEEGVRQINSFRSIAHHCVSLAKKDDYSDALESNVAKLKIIHNELNIGETCGIKKITDAVRDYLDSLEIT